MEIEIRRGPSRNFGRRGIGILFIIIFLMVAIYAAWIYLEWSIMEHMYRLKAGLDWFNIVFYHGYTFIAAALFGLLLINPRPGRSDLWDLISTYTRLYRRAAGYEGEPERRTVFGPSKTIWTLWQVLKWAIGFLIAFSAGGLPYFPNPMVPITMLAEGYGDWGQVLRVFLLPLQPASGSQLIQLMPTMEVQYRVIYMFLWFLLIILAIRFLLRLAVDMVGKPGNIWARDLLKFLIVLLLAQIIGSPYWLMNASTPYVYLSLLVILFGLVLGLIYLKTMGRESLRPVRVRKLIFKVIAGILVLMLIANAGMLSFMYFNWNNNWVQYEWEPQIKKQITVTRWAAGLNSIHISYLNDIPTSNASTILSLVRQWDQQAAATTMKKEIGAYNWMTLPSSEIVFINNTEYWVAPTTIAYPSTDWISEHLIYTHTSRIMVINTYNGSIVPTEKAFGVSREPLIYYGEPVLNGIGGFDQNVYVHVKGFDEVQNVSYSGQPDYVLSGWQRALWFLFAEGQIGFAFNPPQDSIEMLFNRDIFKRVGDILIEGLVEDPSAYLATDGKNIYYVVQLYIDYPFLSGFADSPYLRFFGVVLVNVEDGTMKGYKVSHLLPGDKKYDFLTKFYEEYYSSWGPAPKWLVSQLRYPEQLLGSSRFPGQLDYHFFYHVDSPFVWRSGQQFFERPPNTSVQYIPWAIGDKVYFAGIQLVEFRGSVSKNLAGLYVAFGGDKLGEIYLYQNPSPSKTFIGPSAAENALQTNSMVREQLTLLPNYRIGSYLLYSVGGRLTYFIPIHTNPGVTGVVTQLPFMTAVDPYTANVSIGRNAADAYYNLIGKVVRPKEKVPVLDEILKLVKEKGYDVVNATAMNPTVWIMVDRAKLSNINSTLSMVAEFLNAYGPGSIGNTAYVWRENSTSLDIGFLHSKDGAIELYYIELIMP